MEDIKNIIDNNIAYDLLITKVSEVAREKIEVDAQKTRTRIAIISTAGFAVFIAALTGVASLAMQATEKSIIQSAKQELKETVALGRVDKRDSQDVLNVIQAGICDGDQLGTRPDV